MADRSRTNPETRVDFEAAMRMMFGIGEGEDFDMVYHERE